MYAHQVGVHYAKSWVSKLEMATGLATDPSDMLNEIIYSVRKVGPLPALGSMSLYHIPCGVC